MAKAAGVSAASVHRIWVQPHRAETFKPSSDPQFFEKVRDIVGFYLDPPEKALLLPATPAGKSCGTIVRSHRIDDRRHEFSP